MDQTTISAADRSPQSDPESLSEVRFSNRSSASYGALKAWTLGAALSLFGFACKSTEAKESLGPVEAGTSQVNVELTPEISSLIKSEVEKALSQRMQYEQERLMREVVSNLILRTKTDQKFSDTIDQALSGWEPDCEVLIRDVLSPVVRLSGPTSVGSGVVFNSVEKEGQFENQVITNWHVVRDAIDGADPATTSIEVETFQNGVKHTFRGFCVAHDIVRDLALVKFDSAEKLNAAKLASTESAAQCRPFEWVAAVGCPIGDAPYPTLGIIGDVDEVVDGDHFIQLSAPTYVGNSGGGIFDLHTRELIGVYAKIYTTGIGGAHVISHMGLAIPIADVHKFLDGTQASVDLAKR